MSVLPVAGDDESYWDFGVILAGPSTGCEQHCVVLDNIPGLV